MKHEWKKHEKALYIPKNKPEVIDVPALNFFTIEGQGNPSAKEFSDCVEALYATSYTVRMSYKGDNQIPGYFEYTVYPLEGIWDLIDPSKGPLDKDNFKYAWDKVLQHSPKVLIEQLAPGLDYQLLIINKKLIVATQRCSSEIIGDGEHSLQELVKQENQKRSQIQPLNLIPPIEITPLIKKHLQIQGVSLDTIIAPNDKVIVAPQAFHTKYGNYEIVTEQLHAAFSKIVDKVINCLPPVGILQLDIKAEESP